MESKSPRLDAPVGPGAAVDPREGDAFLPALGDPPPFRVGRAGPGRLRAAIRRRRGSSFRIPDDTTLDDLEHDRRRVFQQLVIVGEQR